MPFNLLKKYPQLLDLNMDERSNKASLQKVFDRDIANNDTFAYDGKRIYPIKTDGQIDMAREFLHLTTEEQMLIIDGKQEPHRVFDKERSMRLHWIKTHIDKQVTDSDIIVFSVSERDQRHRSNKARTYIYNKTRKYVIVLEPHRKHNHAYYLLTAYYLNRSYGEKQMAKKLKAKLDKVL